MLQPEQQQDSYSNVFTLEDIAPEFRLKVSLGSKDIDEIIAEVSASAQNFKLLDLSRNELSRQPVDNTIRLLKAMPPHMVFLDLSSNQLSMGKSESLEITRSIVEAIPPHVLYLSFRYNELINSRSEKEARYCAFAFRIFLKAAIPSSLIGLDIGGNHLGIGKDETSEYFKAISIHPKLQTLAIGPSFLKQPLYPTQASLGKVLAQLGSHITALSLCESTLGYFGTQSIPEAIDMLDSIPPHVKTLGINECYLRKIPGPDLVNFFSHLPKTLPLSKSI